MIRACIFIVLCLSTALAQPKPRFLMATIEGSVLDVTTGLPVGGAVVTVIINDTPSAAPTAQTDSNGRFIFRDVLFGNFKYVASKEGYAPSTYYPGFSQGVAKFETLPNGDRRYPDVVLHLVKMPILTGNVVNDAGQPVPNATVVAIRGMLPPLRVNPYRTKTDAKGAFKLEVLPGPYYVRAYPEAIPKDRNAERGWPGPALVPYLDSNAAAAPLLVETLPLQREKPASPVKASSPPPPAPVIEPVRQSTALVPSFYPNAVEPEEAVRITALAGETRTNLTIRLRRMPLFTLEGRIHILAQVPPSWVGDVRVVYRTPRTDLLEDVAAIIPMRKDTDRLVIPGLIPGAYDLVATVWERAMVSDTSPVPPRVSGRQRVIITDRDQGGVEIEVPSPTLSLTGTSLATSHYSGLRPPLRFAVRDFLDQRIQCVTVSRDGKWTLDSLPHGAYRFEKCPDGPKVLSARLNGHELRYLAFETFQPIESLEVFLEERPSLEEGSSSRIWVHLAEPTGEPAEDVPVIVVIPAGELEHVERWVSSFYGFAEVRFWVLPGKYSIFALRDLPWYGEDALTPELLKQHAVGSQDVEIAAGDSKDVQVSVVPMGRARAR